MDGFIVPHATEILGCRSSGWLSNWMSWGGIILNLLWRRCYYNYNYNYCRNSNINRHYHCQNNHHHHHPYRRHNHHHVPSISDENNGCAYSSYVVRLLNEQTIGWLGLGS